MPDLFANPSDQQQNLFGAMPLSVRMRPKTLEDFVGQEHFIGPGKMLRRMIQADRLSSLIFYGPPGTGKTALAMIVANVTSADFYPVNAATVGVKQIRDILQIARRGLKADGKRSVLFIDELHRFNRAQQDILLDDVENGIVILIGATTQNPFFAINSPLISRSAIFQFETLSPEHIIILLRRALAERELGLGQYQVDISEEALNHLAKACDGDARRALTALEIGVLSQSRPAGEPLVFDLDVAVESIQRKALDYDRDGDKHYDVISAFIKSMRGSDPDAAIYWLARMIDSGEDLRFIARRMVIFASEDVGNADPQALVVATSAFHAADFVGFPEAQLPLAQAVIYLATAEKSNASAMAIWTAVADVKNNRTIPVPRHLRDSHYPGAKKLGHGQGYKYPHDHPDAKVDQEYLGVDKTYYHPSDRGREALIKKFLQRHKEPNP